MVFNFLTQSYSSFSVLHTICSYYHTSKGIFNVYKQKKKRIICLLRHKNIILHQLTNKFQTIQNKPL